MFEKETLDKLVLKELGKVPDDHKIAVLTVANQDGVRVVTAIKVNEDWNIEAYVQAQKTKKVEYGVAVQWSK